MATEGWSGWDAYAPFYDWENARTFGRRDVQFWRSIAQAETPPVLELGCGTGRILTPLARSGVRVAGLDRSAPMLRQAASRARRLLRSARPRLVRGDIRALPFPSNSQGVVIAGYGLLQSLLTDADLDAVLTETRRVLRPRGLFGIDLVPDLPGWDAYTDRECFTGRTRQGTRITLVETVRQDSERALTTFDETFIERRGRSERRHCFSLTFRTVPVAEIGKRLRAAGFAIEATHGDYQRGAWAPDSDAWLILARAV